MGRSSVTRGACSRVAAWNIASAVAMSTSPVTTTVTGASASPSRVAEKYRVSVLIHADTMAQP